MSSTIRFQDGDIQFGTAGEQIVISGAEKAAQDLLDEIFLPYDPVRDRGNELFLADGSFSTIAGTSFVAAAAIKSMIKSAVQRLMRAQATDPGTDASEVITSITSLIVQQLQGDVTRYGFFLAVEVNDENIAVARAIQLRHLGETPRPLVGGGDP